MMVLSQNSLSLLIVCAVVYDCYVSGYYTLSCCTRKCDGGNEVCNLIPGSGSSTNKGRWECVVGCDYSISSPTNGDVVVSGYLVGLSSSFRYAVGANATYACDHGYTLVGATNPRQCLANGTWSGSRPECDPVTCGALSAPANGTVSLSNDDLVESIATFSCDEGFVITGHQQLVCLNTGAWSESAPTCSSVDCPTLEPPCNGLFVDVTANAKPGDVADYACQEGFELHGNSTRICQDDYTWGGISPCCVRTCRQMAEYLLPYQGSSYRQVDTPLSWVEAQENCKAEGAALLELVDVTETVHIQGAFDNTKTWWTGGNDITVEGEWVWPEENVNLSSSGFTNWDSDEDEGGAAENCLLITVLNAEWDDADCASKHPSICECKLSDSLPNSTEPSP